MQHLWPLSPCTQTADCSCRLRAAHATGNTVRRMGTVVPTETFVEKPAPGICQRCGCGSGEPHGSLSQRILLMPFGVLIMAASFSCRPRAAYATGKFSWRAGTVVPTGTIAARPGAALASTAEEGTPAPPEPLPRPRVSLWQRGPPRASPSPMVNLDAQNLRTILA